MLALFPLGNDKTKGTDETPKYLAFGSTVLNRRNDSIQNFWFLGISLRVVGGGRGIVISQFKQNTANSD